MKFTQPLLLMIFSAALISGCHLKTNNNSSAPASNTTNILISNESNFDSAVRDFVANNYKDWEIKSIEDLHQCGTDEENEPCDTGVKITNKGEEKLIVLTVRKVKNANAKPSFVVFEKK